VTQRAPTPAGWGDLPVPGREVLPDRAIPMPWIYCESERIDDIDPFIDEGRGRGGGTLSFLRRGVSIALDILVRDDTRALIDALDELVIAEGGRIYLAKDAFTRAEHHAAMDPRLPAFTALRDRWDPQRTIRSAQSVRVFGDPR
jgi:hypothetical protein